MAKTKIEQLNEFGQSVWLDNINKALIDGGRLKELIALGLRGVTSNPAIFNKAISNSNNYDLEITRLSKLGKSAFEIYDDLTVRDIQNAADILLPIYKDTQGLDGYVSLEVNPKLAYKTDETIKEAKRLHQRVNRPNVMFKIPATDEGFSAVVELISWGININITLIFSCPQYARTAESYLKGIRKLIDKGGEPKGVRSVASVFVSRVDTLVDKLLDEKLSKENSQDKREQIISLKGRAAAANAEVIYKKFRDISSSEEFRVLFSKGANLQRVLWGSTSTKNPAYSDIKYVSELTAKDTVNTLPEKTFLAFLDHGEVSCAISGKEDDAAKLLGELADWGIDINAVCDKLLQEGVAAFERAFDELLNSLERKRKTFSSKIA